MRGHVLLWLALASAQTHRHTPSPTVRTVVLAHDEMTLLLSHANAAEMAQAGTTRGAPNFVLPASGMQAKSSREFADSDGTWPPAFDRDEFLGLIAGTRMLDAGTQRLHFIEEGSVDAHGRELGPRRRLCCSGAGGCPYDCSCGSCCCSCNSGCHGHHPHHPRITARLEPNCSNQSRTNLEKQMLTAKEFMIKKRLCLSCG